MWENMFIFLFIFHLFCFGLCGYPPIGDEVQAGSVLLPASRRGRYLANIVRRQAVDGTGIKFNKDADRMNAEAKKKVDVLSEELLPYIIAEQERRTTLYKRVMTAIQNGEKGVTIAEIRNKPPAIIRKGLMYRCPTNRAPKEPDGSGVIMCEDDIDPRPIMYDSCLSAEDKELYVAENRYFFCNRHKIEGPDPPRNGTAVIGCAPCERTSLNYTSMKCALEDTDDVVVHYRYYPDRTYKFVSELDPDREVCEHWNPCQIGYIFSLPGPDQATLATELWPISEYVHDSDEEMAREEIIPPIPEDDRNETWLPAQAYETSARKVVIPDGYNYEGVGRWESTGKKRVSIGAEMLMPHILVINEVVGNNSVKIKIKFNPLKMSDARTYYARMAHKERPHKEKKFYIPLVTINFGRTHMNPQVLHVLPGQKLNTTSISFTCDKCTVTGVMVRGDDDSVSNLDGAQYRVRKYNDDKGVEQSIIEIDFDEVQPKFFGDYFLMIQNEDGSEEKVRALTVIQASSDPENKIKVDRKVLAAAVGEQHDLTVKYTCDDCELTEILCRGESVLNQGRFTIIPTSKEVSVRFVGFEDSMSCVYMGIFKAGDTVYGKSLVILENSSPSIKVPKAPLFGLPQMGEQFEHKVTYECSGDCKVDKITVNGVPLVPPPSTTRRSGAGSTGFYAAEDNTIAVRVTEFSMPFVGLYQATFSLEGENITKNLLEIGYPYHADGGGLSAESDAGSETAPSSSSEEPESDAGSEITASSSSEAPAEGGGEAGEPKPATEPDAGTRRKGPAKH